MTGGRGSEPGREVSISRGSTSASIAPLGAYVSGLTVDGDQMIKPTSDGIQTHGGIAVLMPYAGRVRHGRYAFEGKEFQLPTRKDGHAIHGFAKDTLWRATARTNDSVTMSATLKGPGYPGTLAASISYSVGERSFSTDCAVRNVGRRDVPIVVGFHPYIVAERWKLESSSTAFRYALEDGYFPTGRRARYPLRRAGPEARLDDCFASAGTIRLSTERRVLTLRRRKMPYFVLYNGKYAEGRSVAVEPYSGLPDAFNNGIGVHTLAPGQTLRCGYDLEASRAV